jgi:hypothetical protein
MNPFLLASSERRSHWKTFRQGLELLDMPAKLTAVAQYWSQAPLLCQRAYDPDDAAHWPTPWELLHYNRWCRNSIAIGMENTLRLANVSADQLTLQLISDSQNVDLLVLIIDATAVLNYNWGSVQYIPLFNHVVLRQWRFTGRSYIQTN